MNGAHERRTSRLAAIALAGLAAWPSFVATREAQASAGRRLRRCLRTTRSATGW